MRKELANSGLSEEEILAKTMLLQKALAGDNSPAFVNKTIKSALQAANISTEDLAKVKKGCSKKKFVKFFYMKVIRIYSLTYLGFNRRKGHGQGWSLPRSVS